MPRLIVRVSSASARCSRSNSFGSEEEREGAVAGDADAVVDDVAVAASVWIVSGVYSMRACLPPVSAAARKYWSSTPP